MLTAPAFHPSPSSRGCQTQEKVVAASADVFVVIADDSKQSTYLGEKVRHSSKEGTYCRPSFKCLI